jgi:DNA-binding protein HU-beta
MPKLLNRVGLARRLARRAAFTVRESDIVLSELVQIIVEELEKGNDVNLVGLGRFFLYQHNPRPVRNPKTNEELILEPYKSLKFKPSVGLKAKLKEISSNNLNSAFEFPEELDEDFDKGLEISEEDEYDEE